jgi:hypothetical protein
MLENEAITWLDILAPNAATRIQVHIRNLLILYALVGEDTRSRSGKFYTNFESVNKEGYMLKSKRRVFLQA